MSTIEVTPQKQKVYNERNNPKQDHGDAAEQKGHQWEHFLRNAEAGWDHRGDAKRRDEHLKAGLADIDDYHAMSPAQLEAAADALLSGSSLEYTSPRTGSEAPQSDRFPTEAELGVKSKHEIRRRIARHATLDVEYDTEDDYGDNDYHVPVHIKNRL